MLSVAARAAVSAVIVVIASAVACTSPASPPPSSTAPSVPALTVERVASLPSLIGTAPSSPVWSPDSTRLAFLWNDIGWPLTQVWVANADGTGLRPLTDVTRSSRLAAATPVLAAGWRRGPAGVTEVLWASPRALFVYRAAVAQPRRTRWPATPMRREAGVSDVSLSPTGAIAFLRDGDLWTLRAPPARRRAPSASRRWACRHRPRAARHLQPRRSRGRHRRVGRRLAAVRVVARRRPHRVPRGRSPAHPEGAVPVVSRAMRPSAANCGAAIPATRTSDARCTCSTSGRAPSSISVCRSRADARSATSRGRRRAACSSITSPTPAPSAGSTWWSRGSRGCAWCGTTAATRGSIRPMSPAGIATAVASWWWPTSAERDQLFVDRSGCADTRRRRRSRPTPGTSPASAGPPPCRSCPPLAPSTSPGPAVSPYDRARLPRQPTAIRRRWRITAQPGVHVPVVSPDGQRWPRSGPTTSRRRAAGRRCAARRDADPCHHVAAVRVRAAHRWVRPRYQTFTQRRGRLRRARPHPRAGRPRPVQAAPGDLRPDVLEHGAQPLGRAERHAAAVDGAARLHRGAGGRAGQRRLRPPLPRGVPDGLRPGRSRRRAGGRRRAEGAAVRRRRADGHLGQQLRRAAHRATRCSSVLGCSRPASPAAPALDPFAFGPDDVAITRDPDSHPDWPSSQRVGDGTRRQAAGPPAHHPRA